MVAATEHLLVGWLHKALYGAALASLGEMVPHSRALRCAQEHPATLHSLSAQPLPPAQSALSCQSRPRLAPSTAYAGHLLVHTGPWPPVAPARRALMA